MDYAQIANDALVAATPYLQDLGKEAVDVGVKSAGKAVFEWIKARLTSASGREAVADVERAPNAAENRLALQAALVKALKADPDAAASLKALLPANAQTVQITGDDNFGVNANGSTVFINRR